MGVITRSARTAGWDNSQTSTRRTIPPSTGCGKCFPRKRCLFSPSCLNCTAASAARKNSAKTEDAAFLPLLLLLAAEPED